MSLEESIRMIVADELDKRQNTSKITPQSQFCKEKNLSRTTVWRAIKTGQLEAVTIGRKVFINEKQFQK